MNALYATITVLALGIGFMPSAEAQRPRRAGPGARAGAGPAERPVGAAVWMAASEDLDGFAETAQLDTDQRSQLESLMAAFRQENAESLGHLEAMREQLREMREDGWRASPRALRELAEEHGHPMRALRPEFRAFGTEVAGVLTWEQGMKVESLIADRRDARRGGGFARGGGGFHRRFERRDARQFRRDNI